MTVQAPDDRGLKTDAGRKSAEYEYKYVEITFKSGISNNISPAFSFVIVFFFSLIMKLNNQIVSVQN